ncbi:hypothetical protein DL98DRAFT_51850 [Cadophora sp. DSE1049]|nr:hypothetical protein DL98DRAFT_51850 [Cadophora sp. DSE1049]
MKPPFYVLSSGEDFTEGNPPNTSLSGSAHDTSGAKYHIRDVETFAIDLNDAAKSAFPNRGRMRYETVNACLIRWEEDELLVEPELRRLDHMFQDYGFTTTKWQIPTQNSHLTLMMKTGELILNADSDKNLFIVYYGGHARINSKRQAEWLCRRDPSSARVHWSAVQTLFAEAQSDVLILLDACAAASATTKSLCGSMEAIMACGFEAKAPPPGEHSFTNTLINVLDDWIDKRSFSASCLHAEILSQLKLKENRKGREGTKLEWCVTPIHINCTQDPKAPSIELCHRNVLLHPQEVPRTSNLENAHSHQTLASVSADADAMDLDFVDTDPLSSPLSSLSSVASTGEYSTPHVIISVALEENQAALDVKETARWLASIPFLAKWAKVEGVFKSFSTLLLVSVPVPVWNMLPDHPAYSFVGYATSPNLVGGLRKHVEMGIGSSVSKPASHSTIPSDSDAPTRAFSNVRITDSHEVAAAMPAITHSGKDPSYSHLKQPLSSTSTTSPSGTIEIFKSVYVNMDGSCSEILLAALKKYNIPPSSLEQYALYVMWNGMERCMEAEDKPLIVFRALQKEGRNPVFMLRKRGMVGETGGKAQPVWGVLYARMLVAI